MWKTQLKGLLSREEVGAGSNGGKWRLQAGLQCRQHPERCDKPGAGLGRTHFTDESRKRDAGCQDLCGQSCRKDRRLNIGKDKTPVMALMDRQGCVSSIGWMDTHLPQTYPRGWFQPLLNFCKPQSPPSWLGGGVLGQLLGQDQYPFLTPWDSLLVWEQFLFRPLKLPWRLVCAHQRWKCRLPEDYGRQGWQEAGKVVLVSLCKACRARL